MEQDLKQKQDHEGRIVRVLSRDIEGNMKIYPALTKVKGISWSFSNLICKKLNLDKNRKIGSLTPEEMVKLSEFAKKPEVPRSLMNRRNDFDTGEDKHLIGGDLEFRTEFDIKRLKKIKSYKGIRHTIGQPLRGQKTRSHFRKNKSKGVGIKKKNKNKQ